MTKVKNQKLVYFAQDIILMLYFKLNFPFSGGPPPRGFPPTSGPPPMSGPPPGPHMRFGGPPPGGHVS